MVLLDKTLSDISSSTGIDLARKQLKEDTKDIMAELIKDNENAETFYRSVIEPLIGD